MRRLVLCALVVANYPCYSRDITAPVPPPRSQPHLLHKPCLNTSKEDLRASHEHLADVFSIPSSSWRLWVFPAGFPRLGAGWKLNERAPLCAPELRVFAQR